MKSLKVLTGVTLAATLIAGCINYDQELILYEDGSGTVMVHYTSDDPTGEQGTPALSFTEDEITAEYANSNVTVRDTPVVGTVGEYESLEATYYLDFDDVADLNGYGVFAAKDFTGTKDAMTQVFTLDEAGDTTAFTQTCTLNMDVEDEDVDLTGHEFTYSVTCPKDVTMTNGKVKLDGHTVVWKFPLPELLEGPVTMYAVYGESGGTGQGSIGPGRVPD